MTHLLRMRLLPTVALLSLIATGCASSQCRTCHLQPVPCECAMGAPASVESAITPANPIQQLPAPTDSSAIPAMPSSPYGESMKAMVRIESPDPDWQAHLSGQSTPMTSISQHQDSERQHATAETLAAEEVLRPVTESTKNHTASSSNVLPRRRVFNDITAHPAFAHASDYAWLVGRLSYSHTRRTWQVRYASVDETDRYGGSFTLDAVPNTTQLQEGTIVRVEGQPVDPDATNPTPRYRVHRIEVVQGR